MTQFTYDQLDQMALDLMAKYSFETASLDEWLNAHWDAIAPDDRTKANQIIDDYFSAERFQAIDSFFETANANANR